MAKFVDKDGVIMTVQKESELLSIVKQHEETLESHDRLLQVHAEQIKNLQDNYLRLENTVMRENRETRETISETNKQLMGLMNDVLGYKSGHNQVVQSMTVAKWETIAKIGGIMAGSGGILYYIFGGN